MDLNQLKLFFIILTIILVLIFTVILIIRVNQLAYIPQTKQKQKIYTDKQWDINNEISMHRTLAEETKLFDSMDHSWWLKKYKLSDAITNENKEFLIKMGVTK